MVYKAPQMELRIEQEELHYITRMKGTVPNQKSKEVKRDTQNQLKLPMPKWDEP